jgi:HlyD family secretion protein
LPLIPGENGRPRGDSPTVSSTREQQVGQPALTYYTVRVTLPPEEVGRLKALRLVPGMPAEAFIQTHNRTPMQYFLKPLSDQIARTFRER